MRREQVPGPGEDGEERSSSPSAFSGKDKNGPGRKPPAGKRDGKPGGKPARPAVAARFAEGGAADAMAPGGELAGLIGAVTGTDGAVLDTLTDQEVLGVLGAVQRLAAWAAWGELVALAEFTRRRPATGTGTAGARAAAEEVAWKTAESWSRMLDQAEHAATVAARLPRSLAAMGQGRLSAYKVRTIENQTADLTGEDVAAADELLAQAGQERNPAALRDYARRLVTKLDLEAAVRRKERARRNAYVRAWQEESGNMGLSAREMPTADGQVAWQNIEARALDLRAAGVEGTIGELQVQAILDYLLGRAVPGQGPRRDAHEDQDESARQDARTGGGDAEDEGEDDNAGAYQQNARAGARQNARGGGRGGWACNPILIIPWDPSLGRPSGPAELPGYGLVDPDDTMDLLRAAGEHLASRWCLTVPDPEDGTAVAHGCVPGRRTVGAIVAAGLAAGSAADTDLAAADLAAALNVTLRPIAKGACEHAHAEPGYRPSRKLRHLVMARNTRCTAPGCGRPAAACDQDHTRPWDDGGLTCECDLAPTRKR